MRTVVVLTLLLGVVYSYCPSHVESRLDQVITKLGKVYQEVNIYLILIVENDISLF